MNNPPAKPVTRFAPSPTGYLHIGHIASAVYVWGIAARLEATVILRIEDHDRGRCRPEYEQAILDDLQWLGFHPMNLAEIIDKPSPFRQSDCHATYEAALAHLVATQKVYACTCSRKQIQNSNPQAASLSEESELRYSGTCRDRGLPLDTPGASLRLALPDRDVTFTDLSLGVQIQNPWRQCGDILLRDRHGQWTYQFAVAVDDLRHDITHVIRGADILPSTGRQILLASWLGRERAAQFFHHRLIVDENGRKLGKRFFSAAIGKRREAGEPPELILGEAAQLVGITSTRTPLSLKDLMSLMSGEGICQ